MVGNAAADILIASAMLYYVSMQSFFRARSPGADSGADNLNRSWQNDRLGETRLGISITMPW